MNFKYKELLVLFAIFEAISGLTLGNSSNVKSLSKDLPLAESATEKFQTSSADKETTESVTVLISNSSNILSKSTEPPNKTVITRSTTPKTTSEPSAAPTILVTPPVHQPWKAPPWVIVNNNTNKTCIIAEMAMQLNITYPGKEQKLENTTVEVPINSSATGICNETSQSLNISWGPGYSLVINFGINKTAKNYFISDISLNVTATVLKDAADNIKMLHFANHSIEFATPLNMSYKCNKNQNVNLKEDENGVNAVLHLKNTHYEAFMNKSKPGFSAAQDCDAFDTPDIVPIAVGCALAILVLVVLVAYLIARKRSHSQGYLSM